MGNDYDVVVESEGDAMRTFVIAETSATSADFQSMRPAADTPGRDGECQLIRWRAGHCSWRPPEIGGERGLMLAVLSDAIACYQHHHAGRTRHARRLFNEARSWLMSERTDAALSFPFVCEVLGIDTERLRDDLRCWGSARRPDHGVRASPAVSRRERRPVLAPSAR